MSYPQLDRHQLQIKPLTVRHNKLSIERDHVGAHDQPRELSPDTGRAIGDCVTRIRAARQAGRPVVLTFGAHTIKNGLAPVLIRLMEEGWVTHLATNGAGIIHDWEFAFQGRSEEDVRKYIKVGQFGIWQETGLYLNLAILLSAVNRQGYGEAIGRLIAKDHLIIPTLEEAKEKIFSYLENPEFFKTGWMNLYEMLQNKQIQSGEIVVKHPFKEYSICNAAFQNSIPLTVHPGFGYDII